MINTIRTLPQILEAIRTNPLKTAEQIDTAHRDINLILYIRQTLHKPHEPPKTLPSIHATCVECPEGKSLFNICGVWFCKDHIPTDVTFPIGLHGDDFKAFQERRK